MRDFSAKLTFKQEQAVAALLSETTVSAAAEKVGINEATLYRWMNLPPFEARYRKARRQVVEKATAQLQQNAWAASTTLLKLLGAGSESIRLRAAMAILDHANKGVEMMDFEDRLEAIEQFAKDLGEPRRGR